MNTTLPPEIFDTHLVIERWRRRPPAAERPDFLIRDIAGEMASRLQMILRPLPNIAIIGEAPGDFLDQLHRREGTCQVTMPDPLGIELGPAGPRLDLPQQHFDAIIVIGLLDGLNDLPGVLIQLHRALKPDGLLLASLLGGESLNELRQAWLSAEAIIGGGASPRVAPFADIRDVGALLQRAGFALPVVDRLPLIVRYGSALKAMRELKAMGLSNALSARSRKPVTRTMLAAAVAAYEKTFADASGRLPLTFDIFYLTAWAPDESQPQPLKPGSAKSRLADALSTKEIKLKE